MKTANQAAATVIVNTSPNSPPQNEDCAPASSTRAVHGSTMEWGKNIEPMLRRIAASDLPILVVGETGSGKEFFARRIHALSPRSHKVFLKLNCAALPPELFERQLFGHDPGPTTGAINRKSGQFGPADKGTILLDEIGDMDPRLQTKLLQILEDQYYFRLGATEPIRVDVRVIATTNHNLEAQFQKGAFREDLYYRLKVVNVVIPPLRERRDEIIPLALSFLEKYAQPDNHSLHISAELSTALIDYSWPGNVRELENAMRSYLVLKDPTCLIYQLRGVRGWETSGDSQATSVATELRGRSGESIGESEAPLARVDQARKKAEMELIVGALSSTFWNRKRAALALKMDYRAFLYKMKKLGIHATPTVQGST